jgi:hypothetical protein
MPIGLGWEDSAGSESHRSNDSDTTLLFDRPTPNGRGALASEDLCSADLQEGKFELQSPTSESRNGSRGLDHDHVPHNKKSNKFQQELLRAKHRAAEAEKQLNEMHAERKFHQMQSEAMVEMAARQQTLVQSEREGLLARIHELESELLRSPSATSSPTVTGLRSGHTPTRMTSTRRRDGESFDSGTKKVISFTFGQDGVREGRAGWLDESKHPTCHNGRSAKVRPL